MPRWSIWPILVVYAVLACLFASTTPYRSPGKLMHQRQQGRPIEVPDIGAPDERQHANYIVHLLEGKGFPVLTPGSPDLGETYQSHQPPLYYLLAAAWCRVVGADPTSPASGFRLRLLNILVGAATVLGVFFAAWWGFRDSKFDAGSVAVAAAGIAGFMPMFLGLQGAVGNDPLLYMLCTWTLALCLRSVRNGWTLGRSVTIGVLIGLGLLTKTTALALIPTVMVAIGLSPKSNGEQKFNPKVIAFAGAILPAILIALPWWMRNQSLYGDPLAMKAFTAAFTGSPKTSDLVQIFGAGPYWLDMFGWWTLRSFFGAFGYMDIFLPDGAYRGLTLLFLVLIVGWVMALRTDSEHLKGVHWTCFTLLTVVAFLYLQFNLTYFQAQSRYLYPAIGAFAIGFGLGAVRLAGRWGVIALSLILLLLDVYVLTILGGEFALRTS